MFVHRIRKYIGAYLVHLKGKVDAIVMSAGVGENSPPVRLLLLADLEVTPLSTFCVVCIFAQSCPILLVSSVHVVCRPLE